MKQVDYLIVGLGLAGTNMVCELERRGRSYIVYDDDRVAASFQAAGLMNPITGRNYAKSWRIDDFLPVALRNYTWFDDFLNGDYYHELDIRRVLNNASEENKWSSRLGESGYEDYLSDEIPHSLPDYGFSPDDRAIHVHGAYRVETGHLVNDLKVHLLAEEKCRSEAFDFELVDKDNRRYKDVAYDNLVCCEGALGVGSPFSHLPVQRNLGEILHIDIPGQKPEFAYKKKVFIVPLQKYYWVGGTYTKLQSDQPAQPNFDKLEGLFREAFHGHYEIIKKDWGLRPTVPDRRPLIGQHLDWANTYVLNGLGTKGASLAPYCASHLVNLIEEGIPLDEEIDIARYTR